MFEKQTKISALTALAVIPVTAMLALGTASAAEAPKNLEELIAGAKKETTLRGMWSASSLSGGKIGCFRIIPKRDAADFVNFVQSMLAGREAFRAILQGFFRKAF